MGNLSDPLLFFLCRKGIGNRKLKISCDLGLGFKASESKVSVSTIPSKASISHTFFVFKYIKMIANNKELKTIVECSHKIMYVDEIYNLFSQPQLSHKYPCSFYIYIEKIINFIYFHKGLR